MSDRGQWTAYALSQDGLHFHDLLFGDSIFSPTEIAGIEGGTRDAYLCRKQDSSGFLMVTTDMNNSATQRLGKQSEWQNYGIDLLTSPDLIYWQSTSIDFRQWQPSVVRVWALLLNVVGEHHPLGSLLCAFSYLRVANRFFGTGHNAVLNLLDIDEWYMIYHRFTRPEGIKMGLSGGYNRKICIDRMEFNDDGTIKPVRVSL